MILLDLPGEGSAAARRASSRSFGWTSAAWPVLDRLEVLGPHQHDVEIVHKGRWNIGVAGRRVWARLCWWACCHWRAARRPRHSPSRRLLGFQAVVDDVGPYDGRFEDPAVGKMPTQACAEDAREHIHRLVRHGRTHGVATAT